MWARDLGFEVSLSLSLTREVRLHTACDPLSAAKRYLPYVWGFAVRNLFFQVRGYADFEFGVSPSFSEERGSPKKKCVARHQMTPGMRVGVCGLKSDLRGISTSS